MFNKVLVLGCTGFIGSYITSLLSKEDVEISCILHRRRISKNTNMLTKLGSLESIKWKELNLNDFDAVFIASRAHSSFNSIRLVKSIKVAKSLNKLIKLLNKIASPPALIYLSGTLSYGNSDNAVLETAELKPTSFYRYYVYSDIPILNAVVKSDLQIYLFRLPWVYGFGSWFKRFYLEFMVNNKYVPVYGSGNNYMSLIHVADCARYILHVIDHANRGIFNVYVGDPIKQKDLSKKISEMTNLPLKRIPLQFLRLKYGKLVEEAFKFSLKVSTIHENIHRSFKPLFPSLNEGLKHVLSRFKYV